MTRQAVTAREQIDSASLHQLVAALLRKDGKPWTEWERHTVAEVTLSLLFRSNICIPGLPRMHTRGYGSHHVGSIVEILHEFVYDLHVRPVTEKKALANTKAWVNSDPQRLQQAYTRFQQDASSSTFTEWTVARDWVNHFQRFGTLVDPPTFNEVARVLGWSAREKQRIRTRNSEFDLVRHWSDDCRMSGVFPPQEMLDAYLVSSLLRGRYYYELAAINGGNYVWHSFRNCVIDPVIELTSIELFAGRLTEVYLAGIICCSAMEEQSEDGVICAWATNVRNIRKRTLRISEEDDSERAKSQAVSLARQCELSIQWQALDKIVEYAASKFVTLVGIGSGILTVASGAPHLAVPAAHIVSEDVARPFVDAVSAQISRALKGSTIYLRHLAEKGAKRIFAITDEDLTAKDHKTEP